jgi:large subunit ribosomal protein L2
MLKATVERLEYDPNRTAFIALIKYEDGEQAYILAPQRLKSATPVSPARRRRREAGQRDAAGRMPVGTIVPQHRDEAGQGRPDRPFGRHLRQLVGRDRGMVIVRLNSGEQRYIRSECMATVGAVSNPDNMNTNDRQGRPQPLARASARTFAASP